MSGRKNFLVHPSTYLRAASLLTLLFALGHSMGGLQAWSPVGENETMRAMRDFAFNADGLRRTYLDFYLGFGWILATYLFLQGALLWQIAGLARSGLKSARTMLVAFVVANLAAAVLSVWFIFAVPTVSFALITALLFAAFWFARPTALVPQRE